MSFSQPAHNRSGNEGLLSLSEEASCNVRRQPHRCGRSIVNFRGLSFRCHPSAVDREGIRFGYEDMTQTEVNCTNLTGTLA